MIEKQLNEIRNEARRYFSLQRKLIRIRSIELLSAYLSQVIGLFILALVFLMFMMIGSFAMAFYLNDLNSSPFLGFVLVGGFYGVLFFLIYLNRRYLTEQFLRNKIIGKMLEVWTESNEDEND